MERAAAPTQVQVQEAKKGEGNEMNDQPSILQEILPQDFNFIVTAFNEESGLNSFSATLRFPFSTADEIHKWRKSFEDKTRTTFRASFTKPTKDRFLVHKSGYHCQHGGHLLKGVKPSRKKTGCKTSMILTIKRKVKYSRSRDEHMPAYPTEVRLYWNHNHPLDEATSLMYRDVRPEVQEEFLGLFRRGLTPTAALRVYTQAKRQERADFSQLRADRAYFPDLKYLYRLFHSRFKRQSSESKGKADKAETPVCASNGVNKIPESSEEMQVSLMLNTTGATATQFPVTICKPSEDFSEVTHKPILPMPMNALQLDDKNANVKLETNLTPSCEKLAVETPGKVHVRDRSTEVEVLLDGIREVYEFLSNEVRQNPTALSPCVRSFVDAFKCAREQGEESLVKALFSFGKDCDRLTEKPDGLTLSQCVEPQVITVYASQGPDRPETAVNFPCQIAHIGDNQYEIWQSSV